MGSGGVAAVSLVSAGAVTEFVADGSPNNAHELGRPNARPHFWCRE